MLSDFSNSKILNCNVFDSRAKFANGARSKERLTNCFELEFIVSANGCCHINDKAYPLRSNAIVFAKPNQRRWSILHFRCLAIHFRIAKSSPYYPLLIQCPDFYPLTSSKKYAEIFNDIIYYVNIKGFNLQNDIVQAKLLELFYLLFEEKNADYAAISNAPNSNQSVLLESVEYINEHYDENLTLEFLANLTHYSPTYYQQLFTQILHVSPQKYILQKRIEAAKMLLVSSQLSMIDIAYRCGFASQSYFCFVFKKETGMSPLHYKKLGMGNFIL